MCVCVSIIKHLVLEILLFVITLFQSTLSRPSYAQTNDAKHVFQNATTILVTSASLFVPLEQEQLLLKFVFSTSNKIRRHVSISVKIGQMFRHCTVTSDTVQFVQTLYSMFRHCTVRSHTVQFVQSLYSSFRHCTVCSDKVRSDTFRSDTKRTALFLKSAIHSQIN